MNEPPAQPTEATPRAQRALPRLKRLLLEGLTVALGGLLFGLAANQISPRGLALARDYFPGSTKADPKTTPGGNLPGTNAHAGVEAAAARLKEKGLQLVDSNQVAQLFRDPRYEQELIVFVDARDDQHYQAGHVPGAYQFDHYHPENYLAAVLLVGQTAERIVIYCNGGNCEDSEFAAVTLSQAGLPKERLYVYAGGMAEWATSGLPVEIGSRKSGNLRSQKRQ